tara:strand:+ start:1103 stop:1897 length:795 start_codon:yes stop_codon:yes gene_type:complete
MPHKKIFYLSLNNLRLIKIFNLKIIIARLRLLQTLFLKKKNRDVVLHGVTLTVDFRDFPSQHIYAYRNLYEAESVDLCKKILKKGMVCIDIGSNVGLFSSIFAKAVGSSGKVYSFEVNPKIIHILKKNMDCYNNSIIYNEFVSNKIEIIKYISPFKGNKETKNVKTVKVDELITEKVDLIKVDIDGIDLLALMSAEKLIKQFKPYILIEISEDSKNNHDIHFLDIISYLQNFGYSPYHANSKFEPFIETKLPKNSVSNLFFKYN